MNAEETGERTKRRGRSAVRSVVEQNEVCSRRFAPPYLVLSLFTRLTNSPVSLSLHNTVGGADAGDVWVIEGVWRCDVYVEVEEGREGVDDGVIKRFFWRYVKASGEID